MYLTSLDFVHFPDYSDNKNRKMQADALQQTAEKWGISARRIQISCSGNRIPGAVRIGYQRAIPDNEPKPADARIKSGNILKGQTRMR